jgi:hypothetical protein
MYWTPLGDCFMMRFDVLVVCLQCPVRICLTSISGESDTWRWWLCCKYCSELASVLELDYMHIISSCGTYPYQDYVSWMDFHGFNPFAEMALRRRRSADSFVTEVDLMALRQELSATMTLSQRFVLVALTEHLRDGCVAEMLKHCNRCR